MSSRQFCVPPGTTGITLAVAQDVAALSLLHVVQVRSGRPSFRVLAVGVKRFEGAAFVESNLWNDQECESWLWAIFICHV